MARLLEVHPRQLQRWVAEGGLTERYADHVACKLGVHPSWIWLDWWAGVGDDRYELTAAGANALREVTP